MAAATATSLTGHLARWNNGRTTAADGAITDAYAELTRIARSLVRREQHRTLDTGSLLHEAYLRLLALKQPNWRNRGHFFTVAAGIMRRVLVDRARARRSAKRGGDAVFVTLADDCAGRCNNADAVDVVALDLALDALSAREPTLGQIVQLRFFAGLSVEQTADIMGVSAATLKRKWSLARAWLHRELVTP